MTTIGLAMSAAGLILIWAGWTDRGVADLISGTPQPETPTETGPATAPPAVVGPAPAGTIVGRQAAEVINRRRIPSSVR